MKTIGVTLLAAAMLLLVPRHATAESVTAELPFSIRTNLTAGKTFTFRFSLFDSETLGTGNEVWREYWPYKIPANQVISHKLGSVQSFGEGIHGTDPSADPVPVDFSQQLWVEVKGGKFIKRVKLNVVPYALWSATGTPGPQGMPGPKGDPGEKGDPGQPGADGATILHGSSDPTAAAGKEDDFYLNTASTKLFGPKTAGEWGDGVSLIGPKGDSGGHLNVTDANGTDVGRFVGFSTRALISFIPSLGKTAYVGFDGYISYDTLAAVGVDFLYFPDNQCQGYGELYLASPAMSSYIFGYTTGVAYISDGSALAARTYGSKHQIDSGCSVESGSVAAYRYVPAPLPFELPLTPPIGLAISP